MESFKEQRESICNFRYRLHFGFFIIHRFKMYKLEVIDDVVYVFGKCSVFNNSIISKDFKHIHIIKVIDKEKHLALDKSIIYFEDGEFERLLKLDKCIIENITKIPSLYDFCLAKLSVYPEIMLINKEYIPLQIIHDYTADPTVLKYVDEKYRIELIKNNFKI